MVDNANPQLPPEAQSGIASVEHYLRQGEPLLAYNAVQEGLRIWPGNLRLLQLQGLAVARSGDVELANQLLTDLAAAGSSDAETLGMLARTHKDLALRTTNAARRNQHLASAFGIYYQAYEVAQRGAVASAAGYTGINAATIAVLQGDLECARRIAAEVRDLCRRAPGSPSAASDYWLQATLGEAALILGDDAESTAYYARAARLATGSFGNLASTRRQVMLLATCLPGPGARILEILKIPPVVMYTGHMIDQLTRIKPRFPIALEGVMAAAIRKKFAVLRPLAAYGSAACGSDILCLEAMREVGGETHIVLPFPADEFHRVSVDFASGGWGERFERALAAADSVTITSDHRARGSTATFEYANLVLTGMAHLRAQVLNTDLHGLAVWDGRPSTGGAGAASLVRIWQSQNVTLEQIRMPEISGTASVFESMHEASASEQQPPGFSHEIRAMLFADAVGYSKLNEDQIPVFVARFLGMVAELLDNRNYPIEKRNTWGDGLYLVFDDVLDAGLFALDLARRVRETDWKAMGLPEDLNLRTGLHAGPVYLCTDPVTRRPSCIGTHVSLTARIEPITPPGEVYASEPFAAMALAQGVTEFHCRPVGHVPLAKSFGTFPMYHIAEARPSIDRRQTLSGHAA
jgi:class 3 adenylate cyclase